MGERGPVLRHVSQLQPFSLPGEQHEVVAHQAAPANRVHAHFGGGPGARHALTAMPEHLARQ